jgi:uncharacterized protein YjbI with pentapeptide repeats
LLSPDSALLGGSEKINVPFAGPVSFGGFMLLGPAVLIALRFYLQLYVEHSIRLDRLARSAPAVRTPTFIPLDNPVIRLFSGLIFYALLPATLLLFAWKAAVFPYWGLGLFGVAAAVIVGHVMLLFGTFRSKVLLSVAVIITMVVILGLGVVPRRPFNLYHANLSDQVLQDEDLGNANLIFATLRGTNLSGANLRGAILSGAILSGVNLSGAGLRGTILTNADLNFVKLRGANLGAATLHGASLAYADLSGADLMFANLSNTNLSDAYLGGANLTNADLRNANLAAARLWDANLSKANLSKARLQYTLLDGANLRDADLSDVTDLDQEQLDQACGNANTKLPGSLTIKPCPEPPSEPEESPPFHFQSQPCDYCNVFFSPLVVMWS